MSESVLVQGAPVTVNGEDVTLGQESPFALRFWKAAPATPDLLFGDSDGQKVPQYDLTVGITLPELTADVRAIPNANLTVAITLPALTLAAEAIYISRAQRPVVETTTTDWQESDGVQAQATANHTTADRLKPGAASRWSTADRTARAADSCHQDAVRLRNGSGSRYQDADSLATADRRVLSQDGLRHIRPSRAARHQVADRVPNSGSRVQMQDALRHIRPSRAARYQVAQQATCGFTWGSGAGTPMVKRWLAEHEVAMRPPAGKYVPVEPPIPPEHEWTADLLFAKLWDGSANLLFGWTGETKPIIVPVRSVYIVINEVSLKRVSNNLALQPLNFSLNIDSQSWTWGFSASFPLTALPDLEPNLAGDPVELEAEINGHAYRVLVERIVRDRGFASGSISVNGRGKSAYLDSPYAMTRSFTNSQDRTAQQLMNDVLTINGVGIGWTVDWRLTDWLVPAGTWVHNGTFISALKTIAAAAGGYLQPHPVAQTMRVLPTYATAPWAWGSVTPDIVLPSALTTREGIEWVDKPEYNAVYVTGVTNGIIAQVKRTGSAGDVSAEMIVDPLITEAAAARQRGIAVLGDTGRQAMVSLRVPILPETGVIEPGTFVQYEDGGVTRRGVVRSTGIDVTFPEVFQSIGVETHA